MSNPVALWYCPVIYWGLNQNCAYVLLGILAYSELVLYGFSVLSNLVNFKFQVNIKLRD